jgi:dethiobiotin synthetase
MELPGGAFSPLTDTVSGAQFARTFPNASVLLVAVDRLGVLHDVAATTRACAALGLPLRGIVLTASAHDDESVGKNLAELPRVTAVPLLGRLPRAPADAPVRDGDPALELADQLLRAETGVR